MQRRSDVFTHIYIGNINRKDFKSRSGVQTLAQYKFGNAIGVFQHLLVGVGRTDARDDTFAYARQNRIFARTTYELLDVGPHRDARFCDELNTILGHGGYGRRIDHLRVDGSLHRFEDVAPRQVDRRSFLKRKVDISFRG